MKFIKTIKPIVLQCLRIKRAASPLKKYVMQWECRLLRSQGSFDDVIATLRWVGKASMIISSLDKDLMQLVEDPLVKMMNTMNNQIYDVAGVEKKFGVHPEQIIDYLALIGDTSDNIPGVPKVGPKTAVKWLTAYKTLKGIIDNADSLTGVVGQNFRDSIPNLDRNVELVTLKKDVDLKVSLESLLEAKENQEELNKLFSSLEFKTWIKSSSSSSSLTTDAPKSRKEYQTVLTEKDLKAWSKKLINVKPFQLIPKLSLDTMTADLIGISLSCNEGENCYVPSNILMMGCQTNANLIKNPWCCYHKESKKLVGQNLKFDLPMLNRHGINVDEFLGDTMLMSYVLEQYWH